MKIVLQRVSSARVTVDKKTIGEIQRGILILLGFAVTDVDESINDTIDKAIVKILNLRIFENENGKLDHSVLDVHGGVLVVPQFTLLAQTNKGRRPDFTHAMPPVQASDRFQQFVSSLKAACPLSVETGEFGADMSVELTNEGPMTLVMTF